MALAGAAVVLGASVKYVMNFGLLRSRWVTLAGTASLAGAFALAVRAGAPAASASAYRGDPPVAFETVRSIIEPLRDLPCRESHRTRVSRAAARRAPRRARSDRGARTRILARAVVTETMPLGNLTGMTPGTAHVGRLDRAGRQTGGPRPLGHEPGARAPAQTTGMNAGTRRAYSSTRIRRPPQEALLERIGSASRSRRSCRHRQADPVAEREVRAGACRTSRYRSGGAPRYGPLHQPMTLDEPRGVLHCRPSVRTADSPIHAETMERTGASTSSTTSEAESAAPAAGARRWSASRGEPDHLENDAELRAGRTLRLALACRAPPETKRRRTRPSPWRPMRDTSASGDLSEIHGRAGPPRVHGCSVFQITPSANMCAMRSAVSPPWHSCASWAMRPGPAAASGKVLPFIADDTPRRWPRRAPGVPLFIESWAPW
jgi:hypothetical protein